MDYVGCCDSSLLCSGQQWWSGCWRHVWFFETSGNLPSYYFTQRSIRSFVTLCINHPICTPSVTSLGDHAGRAKFSNGLSSCFFIVVDIFLSTVGASGYIPEHSLQAHQLAIDLGTDYVEPDLCLSKDLVLMVLHDNTLDETTNIRDHPGEMIGLDWILLFFFPHMSLTCTHTTALLAELFFCHVIFFLAQPCNRICWSRKWWEILCVRFYRGQFRSGGVIILLPLMCSKYH